MHKAVRLLSKIIPGALDSVIVDYRDFAKPQLVVHVKNQEIFFLFLVLLRSHSRALCQSLCDLTAVDWLGLAASSRGRFQLVYNVLSYYFNTRIQISFFVSECSNVHSVSSLFCSAVWLEREVWDMFGVFFIDHPDLRRILTDYGFVGFPLRKDFPLSGYEEVRYDETSKGVVYEPLEMSQELRLLDVLNPWVVQDSTLSLKVVGSLIG